MQQDAHKVSASFAAQGFEGTAPASIVYFPAGSHSISASKGGKPVQVEIEITEDIAALLDGQLKEAIAASANGTASRPFVDFQHEGGRAAALPTGFRWEDGKGVMVDLEWTAAGRAAVEGKDFSYFSPEWLMKDGKVTGLAQPGPIGGLVNTPAFQTIPKIAAALTTMDESLKQEIISLLTELGLIKVEEAETADVSAKLRQLATDHAALKASAAEAETVKAARVQADSDLVTAHASIASLTKQIDTIKAEHVTALSAVENSLNKRVAEIVKAAGVKVVSASTIVKAEQPTMTRAAFTALPDSDRNQFIRDGGKLTD